MAIICFQIQKSWLLTKNKLHMINGKCGESMLAVDLKK